MIVNDFLKDLGRSREK